MNFIQGAFGREGNTAKRGIVNLIVVITGLGGMVGQLVLLRELIVIHYGNELTLGIILANWLLAETGGALFFGSRADRLGRPGEVYSLFLILYGPVLAGAIYYVRGAAPVLLALLPGEMLGFREIFLFSLVILAPVGFLHGAFFPLGCRIYRCLKAGTGAGRVYLYEIVGTLLGGVGFVLLAHVFHSFEIGLMVGLLHLLGGIYLFRPRLGNYLVPLFCLLGLIISLPLSTYLHERSLASRWPDQRLLHYENSPYGNIVVGKREGEYTFFYDGRPLLTAPIPDLARIREYVHLVGIAHPDPQRVLCIGGGLGGMLDELLDHPISTAVYVELDPRLPEVIARFPSPVIERELADPRIEVRTEDGRHYLLDLEDEFDLIILGFIAPDTLQSNRLYTAEFFSLVRRSLREGGLAAFTVPGSHVYLPDELRNLNRSLMLAAEEVFEWVEVIPGDHNIFLMADQSPLPSLEKMAERLDERDLVGMISKGYLEYRLDPEKREWLAGRLASGTQRANRDFHPAALFYALTYWGRAFSPGITEYLLYFKEVKPAAYFLIFGFIMLCIFCLFRCVSRPRTRRFTVSYALWSTGVVGMGFDLLLLFVFQTIYGLIYQLSGLLLAAFMGGCSAGSLWALKTSDRGPVSRKFYSLEVAVLVCILVFYGLAQLLQVGGDNISDPLVFLIVFAFAFLCGGVVGAQFPLACSLVSRSEDTSRVAGILYAADLMGGWFGGLVITFVLFPLVGLFPTLFFLFALKLSSLVFVDCFLVGSRRSPSPSRKND